MDRIKKGLHRYSMPFSFLLLTLIAYWPLLVYCMKFDILDQYLPWRYLVGQCLQNGQFPFWNPFTHLGYPLYADPQSGAWYPVVWLIGGLFGYNIYWIQTEYLFHVWLAGCGMYLLTKALVNDDKIAWLAGASFLLSGFFTGNAQHLTWIISGAWIPFILYHFLLMVRGGQWKSSLWCAICFFMLFTGGYPAFTIVLIYIMIVLSFIIITRKIYHKSDALLFIKRMAVFIITAVLISSVMLVSMAESYHIAVRAEGLSRELAMANPFSPQSLLSWILPFASVKNAEFFQTDTSMSNGYFGLLMLSGFLLSFFRKKTFIEITILAGSLFFLIAAMGSYTPLRGWLYDFIPLMNLFRMPSLFRLFAMTGFILLASFPLVDIYNRKSGTQNLVKAMKVTGLLIFSAIIIFIMQESDSVNFNINGYIISLQEMSFTGSIILQGVIQLISVFVLIVMLRNKNFIPWLVIDSVLACWLCAPITIVSSLPAKELFEITAQFPVQFKLPELKPMFQCADRTGIVGPLWCNLGIWKKQPIWDGYNNFQTKEYLKFEKSELAAAVLKNSLIYQSYSVSESKNKTKDSLLLETDSTLLLTDAPIKNAIDLHQETVKPISTPELILFSPSKIEATVNNPSACYYTLMQQFNQGWKVYVDGKENDKFRSNGLFISTIIPEGKHKITFIYNDRKTVIAFYITVISLLFLIAALAFGRKSTPGPSPYL